MREGRAGWDLGNAVLYDLCRQHPGHLDTDAVLAKVWLIGRAYAAPIERCARSTGAPRNEQFYTERAVPAIVASPLDAWLERLTGVALTWESVPDILSVHHDLTVLFTRISGCAQRSLASKYLHFHRPDLFFLYDSRATEAARKKCVTPRPVEMRGLEADSEYSLFVRRCMCVRDALRAAGGDLHDPRAIDRLFLGY
ncbi:MAG: hypothetical protein Q8P50_11935 [Bacillota bacterium]|nr:hypothetical protein [Bacillota bacterium]